MAQANERYSDTAGTGGQSRASGFRPAFLDRATRIVYPSRYADGRLAPFHVLDGLPRPLVVTRHRDGVVVGVKTAVMAGFVRSGRFHTHAQAARALVRA